MASRKPLVVANNTIQEMPAGDVADLGSLGLSGPLGGFRNRLVNPGFRVNQRNYGGAAVANGTYCHDRWRAGQNGGATYTVNAAAGGPDTYAVISGGTLQQAIEAIAVEGGTYTLSWGGSSLARLTYTTAGSQTTTAYAASPIVVAGVTANTQVTVEFYFNAPSGSVINPQFEAGPIATTFERRPITIETMLCYRYFRAFDYRISPYFDTAVASVFGYLYFDVGCDMRATPSIAYADDGGTAGQIALIGPAGAVNARVPAYTASATVRTATISAYTQSRNAHGCSCTLNAEITT